MAEEHPNFEYLTLPEAARFSRVSIRTLQRQIENGGGPPVIRLTARRILFRREDLTDWLDEKRHANDRHQPTHSFKGAA